jgi:holin-like protein
LTSTRDPDPTADRSRGVGVTVWRLAVAMALLAGFLAVGIMVADRARLPIPGSVLGMVLITVAFQLDVIPVAWVRPAADLLLRHMGLLFVPPGVAVMVHADLIRAEWLPILAGSAASTVAVLLVVGWVQQRMERDG